MTTRSYYRDRPTPTINEQHNAAQLARYLAHHLHPLIAAILAYEDATTTERCPWCWGVTQFINDDFVVTDCPACNGAGTVEPIPSTSPDGTHPEWNPT